jgi:hypothetical protein
MERDAFLSISFSIVLTFRTILMFYIIKDKYIKSKIGRKIQKEIQNECR